MQSHSQIKNRTDAQKWQFFTDREAWGIFRIAAFGEAVGWTLLISGIAIGKYLTPGNGDAVQIAGQIHGTLFAAYIGASLATAASLGWSKRRTIIAAAMSVPPYGTLLFEKWEAHRRLHQTARKARSITVRVLVAQGSRLIMVQPQEAFAWTVPGGEVHRHEKAEAAAKRICQDQLGINVETKNLAFVREYNQGDRQYMELFFVVQPTSKTISIPTVQKHAKAWYELLELKDPRQLQELTPAFLQTIDPKKINTRLASFTE